MSISDATSAFAADMGSSTARSAAPIRDSGPSESMFDNEHEGGEEGGDEVDPEALVEEGFEGEEDLSDEEKEVLRAKRKKEEDDEEEEEEEGDEDKDEFSEEDLNKKIAITVDGKQQFVTLKEAKEGYIRTETFHQRLQQVHDAGRRILTESQEIQQARGLYVQKLDELSKELASLAGQEPDWAKLRAEDPARCADLMMQWNKFKADRAGIQAERDRAEAERKAHENKLLQGQLDIERAKMLEYNPEWNDPAKRKKAFDSMAKTASAAGFSDAEVNAIFDHRVIRILDKAARYDRMMAAKPKPRQATVKTARPGSANSSRVAPKTTERLNRTHSRVGSVDSAANVFQNILSGERQPRRR